MNRIVPRLFLLLLMPLLLGVNVSAWAMVRPENRVWENFPTPSKNALECVAQVVEGHQESGGIGWETASDVHKYLYCQGNPVNGFDPSGHDDIGGMLGAMDIGISLAAISGPTLNRTSGSTSSEPETVVRTKIAQRAASYKDSHRWEENKGPDGKYVYTCSKFVYDVLDEVGHAPLKIGGSNRYDLWEVFGMTSQLKYPPQAGQWADCTVEIPHWNPVFGGASKAEPGDIIGERAEYSDASGHVGIVVAKNKTASASSLKFGIIVINDWGFRPDTEDSGRASDCVVRRYSNNP